jgi:hypothetical protein
MLYIYTRASHQQRIRLYDGSPYNLSEPCRGAQVGTGWTRVETGIIRYTIPNANQGALLCPPHIAGSKAPLSTMG